MFFRQSEPQLQITATAHHGGEHLINGVAVNARSFSDLAAKFAAVTPQEADSAGRRFTAHVGGEDAQQVAVVIRRPLEIIMPPLFLIMLAQGYFNVAQPLNARARFV